MTLNEGQGHSDRYSPVGSVFILTEFERNWFGNVQMQASAKVSFLFVCSFVCLFVTKSPKLDYLP